jgi:hypothetical protein
MSVTRRGDKERRLAAFIGQHLAATHASAREPSHDIRLIARSAESPVFKVIASFAADIAAGEHGLRMIVALPDREALARWPFAGAVDCEVRWARDPRLAEVHEQLVLGPRTCWTGDSMRRDPARCDALETFVDDSAEAAAAATASFERLWTAGEPLPWAAPAAHAAGHTPSPERRL